MGCILIFIFTKVFQVNSQGIFAWREGVRQRKVEAFDNDFSWLPFRCDEMAVSGKWETEVANG